MSVTKTIFALTAAVAIVLGVSENGDAQVRAGGSYSAVVYHLQSGRVGAASGLTTDKLARQVARSAAGLKAPVKGTLYSASSHGGFCVIVKNPLTGQVGEGEGDTFVQAVANARRTCPGGQAIVWAGPTGHGGSSQPPVASNSPPKKKSKGN